MRCPPGDCSVEDMALTYFSGLDSSVGALGDDAVGANARRWSVDRIVPVVGAGLAAVSYVSVSEGACRGAGVPGTVGPAWVLRGATSYKRYTESVEQAMLDAVQPPLGRPEAGRAALIPITKSTAWWELPQDARRAIFEETSHHIAVGLEYLPAVARQLYHGRDLGEPFDFLTWFEFAPSDESGFDQLLARLRTSREWEYVEREIEIRLTREPEVERLPLANR